MIDRKCLSLAPKLSQRMQLRHRQIFSAVVLLLVMMMSLGTKVLHVHHYVVPTIVECADCQHHVFHSGHLLAAEDNDGECMLCQWLTVPYLGEDTAGYKACLTSGIARFCYSPLEGCQSVVQHISLRAPPAFR